MRYLLPALAFVAFAVLGSAGRAQERSEDECSRLQPAIRSPVEMATCTVDLAGSQRQLETALSRLQNSENSKHRSMIEKAHRLWLGFRDAECARKAGGYVGSTMHSSDIIACTAAMNRNRAAEIRQELLARR